MSRRWHIAGLLAAWGAAGAALAAWLGGRDSSALRQDLVHVQFYFLEAGFLALAGFAAWLLPGLWRRFDLDRRTLGVLVGLTLAGLVLVTAVAPRTSRIFYDEQIYLSIGQNLSDLRRAQMCNEGNTDYGRLICYRGEYNKQPYGYPYLLSLVYRLAGVGEWAGHAVNNLCYLLLIWTVYAASRLLFDNRAAALWAAAIVALVPQQLLWSNTAAAEPSAALAVTAAVVAALYFVRERSTPALLGAVAAAAFALQFRPESILVLPLVGWIFACLAPREIGRARTLWGALLGLVLAAALVGHLVAVRGEDWGAAGASRMSAEHFLGNLRVNGWFYLKNVRFPALFTVLAVLGAVRGFRREVLVAVAHFFLFWGVFLFFYAGSYNYGADVRYSLMSYPPLAILAGRGLAGLLALVPAPSRRRLAATAAALLAFQLLAFLPLVRAVGEEAWAARADVRAARQMRAELPPGSLVLTHNPNLWLVWGKNAAQASIAAYEDDFLTSSLAPRYSGKVYFHWNYWCNIGDQTQGSICEDVLERYPNELVAEHRERTFRYALYEIRPASDPEDRGRPGG